MLRVMLGKKTELKMVVYLLQRAGSLVGCGHGEWLMKSIHTDGFLGVRDRGGRKEEGTLSKMSNYTVIEKFPN